MEKQAEKDTFVNSLYGMVSLTIIETSKLNTLLELLIPALIFPLFYMYSFVAFFNLINVAIISALWKRF